MPNNQDQDRQKGGGQGSRQQTQEGGNPRQPGGQRSDDEVQDGGQGMDQDRGKGRQRE